jgi:DNA-directed RNA polymerase specialized sigma24 family protein
VLTAIDGPGGIRAPGLSPYGCQRFLTESRTRRYRRGVTDPESLSTVAVAAASADPADGLRAVRALQRLQERLEAVHVANARDQGWSWQAIADALGVSRQAVHQKYNRRR